MSSDLDKYRPFLKGHALTEEAEEKIIRALWQAVETLVDRALAESYPQVSDAANAPEDANLSADPVSLTDTYNGKEAP